jgi:hypothetical protein
LLQSTELKPIREAKAREEIRASAAKLEEQYGSPSPKADVLKKELQHWNSLREDRRRQSREAAQEHWGSSFVRWQDAAQSPPVRAELSQHAKRVARLERLRFLVATESKPADRARLAQKIARLVELEEGRHQRAMRALADAKPDSAPGAPAPASAAAGGSTP